MILRVLVAEVRNPHRLLLSFSDGTRAEVDMRPLLDDGPVFGLLRDLDFFGRAALDPACGTVVWPNGADFAPEALRARRGGGGYVNGEAHMTGTCDDESGAGWVHRCRDRE